MLKKLAVLSLAGVAALIAADAWTKAAADWNDKDVEQILSDSPWADRMEVETGQRGNDGNADDTKGAIQGNLTAPIVVVWTTAMPIRQALAKRNKAPINESEPQASVLVLNGFPGMFRQDASNAEKLTAETVVKVKGKPD